MLEIFGKGYVIKHCISLFLKEKEKQEKELLYQFYVTDALSVIAENTAHFAGGSVMKKRFTEIYKPKDKKPKKKEKEKTAKEIIGKIKSNFK